MDFPVNTVFAFVPKMETVLAYAFSGLLERGIGSICIESKDFPIAEPDVRRFYVAFVKGPKDQTRGFKHKTLLSFRSPNEKKLPGYGLRDILSSNCSVSGIATSGDCRDPEVGLAEAMP